MAKKKDEEAPAGNESPEGGAKKKAKAKGIPSKGEPSRLRKRYLEEIAPELQKEFAYKNPMLIPRLNKVVVNMGLGEAIQNGKVLEAGVAELATITGQRPIIRNARKSIANFKLRTGMPIGAMVTLRDKRMYEFLDRLMNIALPRVRDFRGLPGKAFDGRGNYSIGLREQVIFPEIDYDKVEKVRGLGVSIVTTARTDEEGKALLRLMGMPFRD